MKLIVQEGGLKQQRRNTEAKAHAKIRANFRHGEGEKTCFSIGRALALGDRDDPKNHTGEKTLPDTLLGDRDDPTNHTAP